jgi:hypothetical protein
MCAYTSIYVSSYYYMCPRPAMYVFPASRCFHTPEGAVLNHFAIKAFCPSRNDKHCALTKINSVTVETETDPGLGCTTSASPRSCGRWLEKPVPTVRAPQEGNISKREVQPHTPKTARTRTHGQNCESAAFYQLCHNDPVVCPQNVNSFYDKVGKTLRSHSVSSNC